VGHVVAVESRHSEPAVQVLQVVPVLKDDPGAQSVSQPYLSIEQGTPLGQVVQEEEPKLAYYVAVQAVSAVVVDVTLLLKSPRLHLALDDDAELI